MDLLALQLAIIFLPGILWARLDAKYGSRGPVAEFELVVRAFLFGIAAYTITYLAYTAIGRSFDPLTVGNLPTGTALTSAFVDEIIASVFIAFAASIFWIYTQTYKLVPRLLQFLKATKRFGDEDVWDFTFNSSNPSVEYVHVHDFEKELTFVGWVDVFSEGTNLRELVLRNAIVYNFKGESLYEVPRVYLARTPGDITIEFPYRENRNDRRPQA